MSSKNIIKHFIGAAFCCLILGCNLETGDWVEPDDRGRLTYTCLSDLEKEVREYIAGNLNAAQVSETMDCVRKALDEFIHIGRGSRQGGFKAEELSNFLNLKFLGDSKITPSFLRELMGIKVIVVGGAEKFVSKNEFRRLIELTHLAEEEARRNAPYMKIYRGLLSDEEKSKLSRKTLNAAKAQLTRTAYNLADLLRSPSGSYKMSSLRKFVEESRIFLKWEEETKDSSSIDEVMEILEVYKMFAVGAKQVDGEEVILPSDWVPFFGTFAQWYGVYLDYVFRLKDVVFTEGEGLKDLIKTANEAMNLVVSSINNQFDSVIKFSLVDRILAQLQNIEVIPKGFRLKESVQTSARYVIEKILRDLSIPLEKAKSDGLRVSHVQEFRKEFYIWADGQSYIDRLYERAGRDELLDLAPFYASVNTSILSAGEEELKKVLSQLEPFYRGSDSRVWIADDRLRQEHNLVFKQNFESLTRINLIKTLARLLIRGFSKEPRRAKAVIGITETEAEDFYRMAKSLGQDLELMDSRKKNVGSRFFKEANLFTFSGNGISLEEDETDDHLLSFQESIEQLALVYSGSELRNQLYESSLEACKNHKKFGEVDSDFGKLMIPKECILSNLAQKDFSFFNNLPGLMEYFKKTGLEGREKFFKAMFDISRPACTDGTMVEFGELSTLTTLAHYVEVVFKAYDKNLDGIMDGKEVMQAYSHFRGFIRPEVARFTDVPLNEVSEQRSKAVFAFLLSTGRIPDEKFLDDGKIIVWWEYRHFNDKPDQFDKRCTKRIWRFNKDCSTPEMEVTRDQILQVLGRLVRSTGEPSCPGDPSAKEDESFRAVLQSLPASPVYVPPILPQNLDPNFR